MKKNDKTANTDETAIDDVRKIREAFDRECGGDIRLHVQQTLAAFKKIAKDLKLKTTEDPKKRS